MKNKDKIYSLELQLESLVKMLNHPYYKNQEKDILNRMEKIKEQIYNIKKGL